MLNLHRSETCFLTWVICWPMPRASCIGDAFSAEKKQRDFFLSLYFQMPQKRLKYHFRERHKPKDNVLLCPGLQILFNCFTIYGFQYQLMGCFGSNRLLKQQLGFRNIMLTCFRGVILSVQLRRQCRNIKRLSDLSYLLILCWFKE